MEAMDMRGVASIAILPSGSISGHFVDAQASKCFGLFGTQIACERECSRGEDYKLINLSILDFNSKKEAQVIVESHGQDAARFQNATDVHGWEEDVMKALHGKADGACLPSIKFECEILKADGDAERHIQKYLPSLAGRGAIVNVGTMDIKGLKFETTKEPEDTDDRQHAASRVEFEVEDLSCHAYQQEDDVSGEEGVVDDLGKGTAHDVSTSMLTSGKGPCSGCVSSSKEFGKILQQELEAEGLSSHVCTEEVLMGWREKKVVPQGSQDSF